MQSISQYREQIDACRPASDDLQRAEFADLAQAVQHDAALAAELQRSQQFDRAVMAAAHDVSVPEGLLARLLQQTAGNGAAPAASAPLLSESVGAAVSEPDAAVNESATPEAGGRARRLSRRGWIIAMTSVAAALVAGVTVFLSRPSPTRVVTKSQLGNSALEWMDESALAEDWKPMTTPPPAGFTIPTAIHAKPHQWRYFRTAAGEQAVVYDLSPRGRPRALFFVVNTTNKYSVAPLAPGTTISATRNFMIGAWQSPSALYVLLIDRDGQRLDDFITPPNVT